MPGSPRKVRTPKKRRRFLEALANGSSITAACNAAVLPKSSAYEWRDDDAQFRADWESALEAGTDILEDEALRRAMHGTDKPVFHQGKQCGLIREYSDTLAIFMLKARRPEKFRDNVTIKGDEGQLNQLLDAIERS